jgi:hypothetical protein
MTTPWRRLALAAMLFLTAGSGLAAAQTVIVRNLPAGAPVEILFDGSVLAAAKADEKGDATVQIALQLVGGDWESNVKVYVDVCGELHRIGLVDRLSLSPTPADGCQRREVTGLYVMKSLTHLLVAVGGSRAAVWLRQGPVPKEWMAQEGDLDESLPRVRRPAPTGLVLFGGAGLGQFRTGTSLDCGDNTECTPANTAFSFTAGVAVWVTRWLAVEGAYTQPATLQSSGSGNGYQFDSSFESQLITGVAKVGPSIGPFRPYGIVGGTYQRSLHSTTQVSEEASATENDVTTTFPGNTQTWATATDGIGWLFGGGAEVWLTKRLGIYGEITRLQMKGTGLDNAEGTLDERLTLFWGGVRVKVGK